MIETIAITALVLLVWFFPTKQQPKGLSNEEKAISNMWNRKELT